MTRAAAATCLLYCSNGAATDCCVLRTDYTQRARPVAVTVQVLLLTTSVRDSSAIVHAVFDCKRKNLEVPHTIVASVMLLLLQQQLYTHTHCKGALTKRNCCGSVELDVRCTCRSWRKLQYTQRPQLPKNCYTRIIFVPAQTAVKRLAVGRCAVIPLLTRYYYYQTVCDAFKSKADELYAQTALTLRHLCFSCLSSQHKAMYVSRLFMLHGASEHKLDAVATAILEAVPVQPAPVASLNGL
eukprot:4788-Heterococcus_DN1.PRE.1